MSHGFVKWEKHACLLGCCWSHAVFDAANPTAIPHTEPRRQRLRDTHSWSGHRIVWSLSDQVAFLGLLKDLRMHPMAARRPSANVERVLRHLVVLQCGENPDHCPRVINIAAACDTSERTVQRSCRDAETLGLLEVRPRHRLTKNKRATAPTTQTTNRYLLLLPKRDEMGSVERRVQPVEPVDACSQGVTDCHPTTDNYSMPLSSTKAEGAREGRRAGKAATADELRIIRDERNGVATRKAVVPVAGPAVVQQTRPLIGHETPLTPALWLARTRASRPGGVVATGSPR